MAHTNSTTNYHLPQFISSDKPAWLTDVNGAYSDIDTGMKNAQDAADSAQGDATQALLDASAAMSTASSADAKATGAIASLSNAFSDTSTYSVGDYVIYNNILYTCIVAVTVPGPWSGTLNWNRATINTLSTDLKGDISNLESEISNLTAADIEYDSNNTVADKLNSLKIIKTGKANYSGLKGGGWADRVTVSVTFDSPMPNNSYVAFAMINDAYSDFPFIKIFPFSRTTTGFTATCINVSGSQTAVAGSFDWVVIGT